MPSIPQIQPDYARFASNARPTESTRRSGYTTAKECRVAQPRYASGHQLFVSRAHSYDAPRAYGAPHATVAKEYRPVMASTATIRGTDGPMAAAEACTAALLMLHAIHTVRPRVSVVVVFSFSFSFFAMAPSYLPQRARRPASPAPAWQPPPPSVRIEEMPREQPVRRASRPQRLQLPASAPAPVAAPAAALVESAVPAPVARKAVQTAPLLDDILTGQAPATPVVIPSVATQEAALDAQGPDVDLLGAAEKLAKDLKGVNEALRQPTRNVDQMMADLSKDLGL